MSVWLSWLRRQTHKQQDAGSSLVQTIKIGLKIIIRSDIIKLYINK